MAHVPSGRNHRIRPSEELNLVPMIDVVTNLMFFLMMFASVIPITMIDAPLPKIASTAEEVRKAKDKDNAFELTVEINKAGFNIRPSGMGNKSIPLLSGAYDFKALHQALVEIHQKKPNEAAITLMPSDEIPYEIMIQVMDQARELLPEDPGFQTVPPEIAGKPESQQFNRLFPEVSIGGV